MMTPACAQQTQSLSRLDVMWSLNKVLKELLFVSVLTSIGKTRFVRQNRFNYRIELVIFWFGCYRICITLPANGNTCCFGLILLILRHFAVLAPLSVDCLQDSYICDGIVWYNVICRQIAGWTAIVSVWLCVVVSNAGVCCPYFLWDSQH